MHGNGQRLKAAAPDTAAASIVLAPRLPTAFRLIRQYLSGESEQQRFEFFRDERVSLPPELRALQEIGELFSMLLDRHEALIRRTDHLRVSSPPRPAPAPDIADAESVTARLTGIESNLSFLGEVLDENTKLRQRDFQFGVLGPIAIDVIEVIDGLDDDLAGVARTGEAASSPRETKLCKDVGGRLMVRRDELLSMLSRRAIERFVTPLLAPMEPGKHKPIPPRVPHKGGHKGLIAGHLRPGYWRAADGWVVRPQLVEVFAEGTDQGTPGKGQA